MFHHSDITVHSVLCITSHLWFGVSVNLAGEGDWHALKDFIVFELLVKEWRHPLAGRVFIVLHIVIRLLHWRTLQAELNLADQALLKTGHFVFLNTRDTNMTD